MSLGGACRACRALTCRVDSAPVCGLSSSFLALRINGLADDLTTLTVISGQTGGALMGCQLVRLVAGRGSPVH